MTSHSHVPKQSGYLFGRHSVWVYLAGAALAIWYRLTPLVVVCVFLLLLSALILLWRNKALSGLKPELAVDGNRRFAGESFTVTAAITNEKWLPLVWLEWEFPRYDGIAWGDDGRERHVVRLLWIMWHQKLSWRVRGEARQRGVYNLGAFLLRSGDGFRFSESEIAHELDRRLYVYPRLVPVNVPPYSQALQWSAAGRRGGLCEDRLLLAGVRDYEDGDEWRKVNWKASARVGKLQTNLYEPIVARQLYFYLDVRGFEFRASPEEAEERQLQEQARLKERFEAFLSVIASLAVHYGRQGVQLGFASNARGEGGRLLGILPPAAQPVPVLDKLAEITPQPGTAGTATLDRLLSAGRLSAPLFIFCAEIDEALYRWQMRHRHQLPAIRFFHERESELAGKCGGAAIRLDTLRLDAAGRPERGPDR